MRFNGFRETEMIEFLVTHEFPWGGRRFSKGKKGLAGGGRDGKSMGRWREIIGDRSPLFVLCTYFGPIPSFARFCFTNEGGVAISPPIFVQSSAMVVSHELPFVQTRDNITVRKINAVESEKRRRLGFNECGYSVYTQLLLPAEEKKRRRKISFIFGEKFWLLIFLQFLLVHVLFSCSPIDLLHAQATAHPVEPNIADY